MEGNYAVLISVNNKIPLATYARGILCTGEYKL
jgi:hypothetical protein